MNKAIAIWIAQTGILLAAKAHCEKIGCIPTTKPLLQTQWLVAASPPVTYLPQDLHATPTLDTPRAAKPTRPPGPPHREIT
jgi:hypothetical protein